MTRLPSFRLRPRATRFLEGALCLVVFLLVAVCPAPRASADEPPPFRVIVHTGNPATSLERRFLANGFLKEITEWADGETIRPVDLKPGSATRKRFSEAVLNRSVAAVKSFWQQRIFSGRGVPPPELESEEAVVSYVKEHRGAVGYVSPAADVSRVKVVRIQ